LRKDQEHCMHVYIVYLRDLDRSSDKTRKITTRHLLCAVDAKVKITKDKNMATILYDMLQLPFVEETSTRRVFDLQLIRN
jgi:hypothetical protein